MKFTWFSIGYCLAVILIGLTKWQPELFWIILATIGFIGNIFINFLDKQT